MKKTLIIVLLLALSVCGFAQDADQKAGEETADEVKTFSLDLGPVVGIGFPTVPADVPEDFAPLYMLLTLRGGIYLDLMFNLNETIHIGAESGILLMELSIFAGDEASSLFGSTFLIDVPIRGFVRFTFGPFFIQPHAGVYLPLTGGTTFVDLGGKVGIGGGFKFFVEGSYLIGDGGYPRVALGGLINLFNI